MSSAADRIPLEIWEQILLKSDLSRLDAFRLQRVSRSFNRTINGSTPLLRLMEIVHKPTANTKYRIPNVVLETSDLQLWPFIYRTEVLSPASAKNLTNMKCLNVHVKLDVITDALADNSVPTFGMRPKQRDSGPVLDGSWRRMLISRYPFTINILIRISYLDNFYEQTTCDPSGLTTLGELADMLGAVHKRTREEHQRLIEIFQNAKAVEEVPASQDQQCRSS